MTAIVRKPPPSADSCTPPEAAAVSASCVSAETPVSSVLPETGFDMEAELTRYRRWMVDQALVRTQGNRARAAKLLGLNRTTLVEMLKREGTFMRAAGAR